jgi:uncharacterized damage-inducible protein DinB
MIEWTNFMLTMDELDIAPKDGGNWPKADISSKEKRLAAHSAAVKKTIDALKKTNDEYLLQTKWKLLARGKVMNEGTRYEMIRDTVLNHLAHHRGQLTVYLRLLSSSVPAIYGPSADEGREIYS